MISLPNISLIALTGKDFEAHKRAVDTSCEKIDFGAVKIIWDEKIKNIDDWNYKIVYDLYNYIDTSHALLIHADGYVIHPELWNPEWLALDYIGAPFPLPTDDYSYRDEEGEIQRVGIAFLLEVRDLWSGWLNLNGVLITGIPMRTALLACITGNNLRKRGLSLPH